MKNNYKFFFLLFLINFSTLIWSKSGAIFFAQNKNIDSLFSLLNKDKTDTNKVNHSDKLCSEYIKIGLYDTAIYYANLELQLAQQINFKKGIANSYGDLGAAYYYQGHYSKTLDYWLKALKIEEELKNKKGITTRLGNIGTLYWNQGDYPKALDYYLKALKISEDIGDKNKISAWLGNIGIVYADQHDYPKALNYYFKALKIAEELKDKNGITVNLSNIGIVYDVQSEWSKALDYYFKALKMAEELGDKNGIAIKLGNIGTVYAEQKEYSKSLDYFFKALKTAEELGDKNLIARHLSNIGSVYTETGKFKEAEKYLKSAIAIDDSIGSLNELMQFEESISQLYDTIGQHKEALLYYKKAMALKDTLFSQENKKQLVQKEMNYDFEKKEAITKADNEKQQAVAEEKNHKQKIITWSIAFGLLLVLLFAGFIFRSLRITRKQKQIIENKSNETELQKKIIEEKNKDITDSIHYAKRIQDALLREEEHVSMHLPEHFILFIPKDIVSGDFYWGTEKMGYWYFAAVDCTGHGVPGAVMSMLGISFLNDIVASEKLYCPAEILNHLRDKIIKELRQTGKAGDSKDGMDISLCRLNLKTNELQWAGAYNPLSLFRNGQLEEVKADKQPIGYHPESRPFTNHEIQMGKGDSIYIYSDGYADQFGGPKGKKFKYKQFEDLIIANNHLTMKEQKELLKKHFIEWKGSLEQVDDVCVFGIRI